MMGLVFGGAGGVGGVSAPTVYDLSAAGFTLDSGNEIDIDVSTAKGLILYLADGAAGVSDFVATRFSTDGGSTFRSGASDYNRSGFNSSASFVDSKDYLILTNAGTAGMRGFATFYGFNNANIKVGYHVLFSANGSGGASQIGNNGTAEAVDTVRVFTHGGNAMTAGQLLVWLIL